jgi:hypothetical protein
MSLNTVREIERAIGVLTPREIEDLYAWLEQHYPPPIDARVQSDLAAGRLDTAIQRALDDDKNGPGTTALGPDAVDHQQVEAKPCRCSQCAWSA